MKLRWRGGTGSRTAASATARTTKMVLSNLMTTPNLMSYLISISFPHGNPHSISNGLTFYHLG